MDKARHKKYKNKNLRHCPQNMKTVEQVFNDRQVQLYVDGPGLNMTDGEFQDKSTKA